MRSTLGLLLLLWLCPSIAAAQEVTAANTARYLGDRRWEWIVYVDASPQVLGRIKCVEYRLPPTFPKPVQSICQLGDKQRPFGLTGDGWGSFVVSIKVSFVDGRTTELKHTLSFAERPAEAATAVSVDNVARKLRDGYWEWTAFIQGPDETLNRIKCVQYTLHPTFPNPVRDVCVRGTGPRAFPLTATGWGTFQLKVRVFFTNGTSLDLTHTLKV